MDFRRNVPTLNCRVIDTHVKKQQGSPIPDLLFAALCALGFAMSPVSAADKVPISTDGSDPRTWDMKQDGVLIAPQNHKVLYEDDEVRVQLVTVPGGTEEPYHLHPYWAVLVNVAVEPTQLINRDAWGHEARNWTFADLLVAPVWVAISPPGATHSIKNLGTTPDRRVRVEFKKGTIPTLIHPDWPNGKMPISTDGTDPKTWDPKLDGPIAAPGNHKILFEDADIRVQLVTIPVGTAEPFHDHPYPSVLIPYIEAPYEGADTDRAGRVSSTKINGSGWSASAALQAPTGLHSRRILGTHPEHLVRIEFKKGFPQL